MKYIIRISVLVITIVMSLSFVSQAYTEEQKQQAKAWLSAHGYSPDMGGASQAYQDYLNGKFDEELGVDVNGDGIPAPPQTTEDEENTEEYADADVEEEDDTEENIEDANSEEIGRNSETESTESQGRAETEVIEDGMEQDEQVEVATESMETVVLDDEGSDEAQENTLYQPERKGEYQEAVMVIILATTLMLLMGMWLRK